MNRLQRLYEAGIYFELRVRVRDEWMSRGRPVIVVTWCVGDKWQGFSNTSIDVDTAIDALWSAAREDYPDAECFKEEHEIL